uniref:Peroxisome proliferator-activated receptor gamma coactivator 1-alpha n=1 Tax=Vombatus ursinus TaxID=29139 RepID=A0A4X2K8Q8_VOMUR
MKVIFFSISPLQCAALVGEDQPLCPDLPELDLSELDVNDLDADGFLGGLKWCSDQSEIISNQYSNESSNIFEVKKSFLGTPHLIVLLLNITKIILHFKKTHLSLHLTLFFPPLGLTPPTTPPHKANQDNPFRTSPKQKSSCKTSAPPSKKPRYSESSGTQVNNPIKKGPEQSELYAQLSKTSVLSSGHEERKAKRPSLRLFGDHDYCQSINAKTEIRVNLSQELQDSRQLEYKDASPGCQGQTRSSTDSDQCYTRETFQASKQGSPCGHRKQLQDQEIRAELNKHFGHPSQAVFDDEADKTSELRNSHFSNEQFSKLPMFINSGLAMDGLFDDSEDESDKLRYPWDGTQSYSLFDVSPSCSSFNSPCRDSVSPPKSLFSQRSQRIHSRSRSFSRHRSCSRSPYSRSRSRSPGSRSSSRPCYFYESSHCRHRGHRSSPLHARSRSRSPYGRRPRYDSYEEYQHEKLKREEYRKEYEKRESERAKQRERQRQKAIEERRVIYVGKIRPDTTRTELRDRFEVFGEIEECTVNLRDDGDSYGFITYRYTCDAFAALENGYTLRRSNEPDFELYFCGRKQYFKSNYADLDSHSDDFDPASTKSKYDSLDFDSLLKEAQRSLRR